MIELRNQNLDFNFPAVHGKARCQISFQRTLRIPDDNQAYPLPPGLGKFPIEHVDDYAETLPPQWKERGGVFIPMYQSEALWINFSGKYPCAIKVAAGKIDAVTGHPWSNRLSDTQQNYMVIPEQPWLDGFNVTDGLIRQFLAMPLGEGFTAEEQINGNAEHGGLQLLVYPMTGEAFHEYFPSRAAREDAACHFSASRKPVACKMPDMGLAPGGLMHQEIYQDQYGLDAWDLDNGLRCYVHLANSEQYFAITGNAPPYKPVGAKEYNKAGMPWFDYYSDSKPLDGSSILGGLTSVAAKAIARGKSPMVNNESLQPNIVKKIGGASVVREGSF